MEGMTEVDIEDVEEQLNDFDPAIRAKVLEDLGETPPSRDSQRIPHFNLHAHTFYSYNGYGASPSRIAWEAWRRNWYAVAICDFDVLDGVQEFLNITDRLGVRAAAHMETRVIFPEYIDQVINSPGEPGVYYFMGAGFTRLPDPGSAAETQLIQLRQRAQARNRDVLARVNDYLSPLTLDFEMDVLPLTPAGNPTERHIVQAYYEKAGEEMGDGVATFWANKLNLEVDVVTEMLTNPMAFTDTLRSKLMKAGGPGYVKPDAESFPKLDDVIQMILDCEAIPMGTWLDGTNPGESDPEAQLECLRAKGVCAVNIVPDRNWNIKDIDEREEKIAHFHEFVAAAEAMDMPINVGTELNKYGQRWVDDFSAEPMRAVADVLQRGARVMVGHTRLARFAGMSYTSENAEAEFGDDFAKKNRFYAAIGALPPFSRAVVSYLKSKDPADNYSWLRDAVKDAI
jgi:hypothetical protein